MKPHSRFKLSHLLRTSPLNFHPLSCPLHHLLVPLTPVTHPSQTTISNSVLPTGPPHMPDDYPNSTIEPEISAVTITPQNPPPHHTPETAVVPLPTAVTDTTALRRSTHVHTTPSYLKDYECAPSHSINFTSTNLSPDYHNYILQVSSIYEPLYYHQACKSVEWCKAMEEEINALEANNTWSIQPLPLGKKSIGCKWIFKVKYKADSTLDR